MPRHHLVPQMYLRRFADECERLTMVSRDDGGQRHTITVNNACNEVGFYAIPPEDLAREARVGHDPEMVEKTFSDLEGDTKTCLDHLLAGTFPPSKEERYRISFFAGMQLTRGWSFRADLEGIATALARRDALQNTTRDRAREILEHGGKSVSEEQIDQYLTDLKDGPFPKLKLGPSHAVQASLDFGLNVAMPEIYFRTWTLRVFDEPALITGDSPIVTWSAEPERPEPGVANADAIWWPVSRTHLLSFSRAPGPDRVRSAPLTRAHKVNDLVANAAQRWVFCHPDDAHLVPELRDRAEYSTKTIDFTVKPGEIRHVEVLGKHRDA